MLKVTLHSLCALAVFALPLAAQTTWHVDLNGVAPGTGTPGDPYTSIQYAIVQPTTLNGDVILIAPGTYTENIDFGASTMDYRGVTLRSTHGPHRTVIRPAGPEHLVTGFHHDLLGGSMG